MEIVITGRVETFAHVQPDRLSLIIPQGQSLSAEIEITPRKEYPFKVTGVAAHIGRVLRCEIKERCAEGNNRCIIKVETLQLVRGYYNDTILVKTDSPLHPEISVYVTIRII